MTGQYGHSPEDNSGREKPRGSWPLNHRKQLTKEGLGSVAPVVIPALVPTLNKSLKSDRSICRLRGLRLLSGQDLRQSKELVFVSFKKGFDKDISHGIISSWIKQIMILCCELSDQEALTLH